MAKIIVYEDSLSDVETRYSRLLENNDVHLRLDDFDDYCIECLVRVGFDAANIRSEIGDPSTEKADVYFVDGLSGKGLDVLESLPKDRAYLFSDHTGYNRIARERGYGTIISDKMVDDAIRRASE